MRRGTVIAVLLVPSVVACGLTITGIDVAPSSEAGAIDGGLVGDAPNGNVDAPSGEDAPSLEDAPVTIDDAGVDADAAIPDTGALDSGVFAKCLSVCTGPNTIGCANDGTCIVGRKPGPIVCPAGVPCLVQCDGNGDCTQGIDCMQASACTINCTGANSCADQAIKCAGSSCTVVCSAASSCGNGLSCTADTCDISCLATSACAAHAPDCETTGNCIVRCGLPDGGGTQACQNAVTCKAAGSCEIDCNSDSSCSSHPPIANGAMSSTVKCVDGSCSNGVHVSGKKANVACQGDACSNGISCDAGTCNASCGPNRTMCCGGGSSCISAGCNQTTNFGSCE